MTTADVEGVARRSVVMFGSYDESLHPRVAVLREGLTGLGDDVTEINAPLGLSTADKIDAASSLAGALRLLMAILVSWMRLLVRSRGVTTPDLVVVGYLGHFDVHLARLRWPRSTIVLDHLVGLADTARDRGLARGLKFRILAAFDAAALRRADVVVVDTDEQLEQLPVDVRSAAVVVPVGATEVWFDQGGPPTAPPVRVCFVGLFTPLHGAPVIGRAIARLRDDPRLQFTMVGSGQDHDETRRQASGGNVTWLDWVPSDELPALVASQHVCLGIFGTTPKALRVVPTKVYQGLAAGNIVITSDTQAQRRALGDAARFVPPGDDEALAAALSSIADELVGAAPDPPPPPDRSAAGRFRPVAVVAPLERRTSMTTHHNLAAGPALPPNAWLRFDLLRGPLESLPPSKVLEIGPGRGAVASRLTSAGHDYTGVEMSDDAREATAERLRSIPDGTSRLLSSIDELLPEEQFDLVCAFEVLEHIDDDRAALGEWVAHLAPGGLLLLSVPAWPDRFSTHDVEVGHLRRYEPTGLAALAESVGLVDVEARLYGFPLGFALESIRNTMAKRIQKGADVEAESALDRTQRSGGWFQPPRSANALIQAGTWPFRLVQRAVPGRGTGLVLIARAPTGP